MKVAVITIGCPKNEVDSKIIENYLSREGLKITSPEKADIVIINTCGFIEDAKKESIEEIFYWISKGKKVWVGGCLVERYKGKIESLINEVEGWFYLKDIRRLPKILKGLGHEDEGKLFLPNSEDIKGLNVDNSFYVKIADGCDNRCNYCTIPIIRGPFRSRPLNDIMDEVKYLIDHGVFELNIIAQDTTSYGKDVKEHNLVELIQSILSIDGDYLIRILYAHPAGITKELIELIAKEEKIAKYIEMPIQHINENILTKMNRKGGKEAIIKAVQLIKDYGIFWRTTVLVGHPGETEETVEELINFLTDSRPWRASVFAYSREEGTVSFKMRAPSKEKIHEWTSEVNEAVSLIMEEESRSIVGTIRKAIGTPRESRLDIQAPQIDGVILGNLPRGINWVMVEDSNFVDFKVSRL
ncbi:MAG: MiaB/RimO family radical SAM methylthiotransferase [candidate division WOR-3 bacterium]